MKTILIIEDDPDIIDTLRFVLMETGHIVDFSTTSASITFIEESRPDLIFLDYDLRNGSGKDLCVAIKTNVYISDIPVVLLSSDLNISIVATDCGADSFIKKPIDIDELIYMIDRFFSIQAGSN